MYNPITFIFIQKHSSEGRVIGEPTVPYSPNVVFTVLKKASANSVTPRLNKMKDAEMKMSLESYSLTVVASLNGLNLYMITKLIIT